MIAERAMQQAHIAERCILRFRSTASASDISNPGAAPTMRNLTSPRSFIPQNAVSKVFVGGNMKNDHAKHAAMPTMRAHKTN